jgi:macrodomain Ter protein organizer (MatP/YcbG family)
MKKKGRTGKISTPAARERFLYLIAKGVSKKDIAAEFKIHPNYVYYFAKTLGQTFSEKKLPLLPKKEQSEETQNLLDMVKTRYENGVKIETYPPVYANGAFLWKSFSKGINYDNMQ